MLILNKGIYFNRKLFSQYHNSTSDIYSGRAFVQIIFNDKNQIKDRRKVFL